MLDESVANRVLFSVSADARSWSEPRVLFNTTAGSHHNASALGYPPGYDIGLENEAWFTGASGALYAMASSWDVFQRRGKGAEHVGPDVALMRRVHLSGASIGGVRLGPPFWLAPTVPRGFDTYCNTTFRDAAALGETTSGDAARLMARVLSTVPPVDAGKPNERSLYSLPAGPAGAAGAAPPVELVTLMRAGNDSAPHMWASRRSCTATGGAPDGAAGRARVDTHGAACRPGTGIWNHAWLDAPDDRPLACTPWSTPQPTNIPDSHSRSCAAALADGRRWLVGAMLPKGGLRSPLTLALSKDGMAWGRVWSLRGGDSLPKPRFDGYPGFQYPSGVPSDGQLWVAYSVNKEDIAVTSVPLGAV